MNTNEIEKVIQQNSCAPEVFAGVFARDRIPKRIKYPCSMVWNTDPAHKPGEHWVAVHLDEDGIGEYFDSYGLEPPACFKRYMQQNSVKWTWNTTQLQDVWTSACGYFCVFYIIYRSRGIPMSDIVKHLNNIEENDQYVMQFVSALF